MPTLQDSIDILYDTSESLSSSVATFRQAIDGDKITCAVSTKSISMFNKKDYEWRTFIMIVATLDNGQVIRYEEDVREMAPISIDGEAYRSLQIDKNMKVKSLSLALVSYCRSSPRSIRFQEVMCPMDIISGQDSISVVMKS